MIGRSGPAWGAVYHSSNTKPTFAAIRAIFGPGVRNAIADLLREHDPDVVLSVHPLLNQISHQAIQKSGRPRALMTVITDLVDFHRGWTFSKADLVVAPTELARNVALRRRLRDIAEALGTGVPVLIPGLLPGQESPNVDFVVEAGFGAFTPREEELLDEVRVLAEGGPTWQEMSRKAAEMAHPYASSDIARECLLLAARYRASGQTRR